MKKWILQLRQAEERKETYVLATIVKTVGSTPRKIGAKMIIYLDGSFTGTLGGGYLEQSIIGLAAAAISEGESKLLNFQLNPKTGQCCGGNLDIFMDVIKSKIPLYIFGAGHIGQALCRILSESKFQIYLIDERSEWVFGQEIPEGIEKNKQNPIEYIEERIGGISSDSFIVILTHSHALDFKILSNFIESELGYLGMIGSCTKRVRFEKNLVVSGVAKQASSHFFCPMGEKLKGDSPQEIAISIAFHLLQQSECPGS